MLIKKSGAKVATFTVTPKQMATFLFLRRYISHKTAAVAAFWQHLP